MTAHVSNRLRGDGQDDLFGRPARGPEGFRYQPDLITADEEAELISHLEQLQFEPFNFQGHLAHRQVVGFGYRYDYSSRTVRPAPAIPDFLQPLRQKIGVFSGMEAEAFQQVLINQYKPGAGIGWHKDKPHFEHVVGVSLSAPCLFRFRQKVGAGWERIYLPIEPRSAYLLTGPSRRLWEHSIPPLDAQRFSITLRTLAA
jgi:alkylated DNA repair dioxygenase AlkB